MGGNAKKTKGRLKQAVGALTGDKKLQRSGKREERVGSLEKTADDATDAVHETVDEVVEKVSDKKKTPSPRSTS